MNTPTPQPALATAAQVEALADQLGAIADELHARVMKDIRNHADGNYSEADKALARAMLDDEQLLRQRANGLYVDAAVLVVQTLGPSQQVLMQLTADAAEKIRKIGRIADIAGLVGGLLGLAGAVATGQPAGIVLAIEKVGKQVKKVAPPAPNQTA